MPLHEKLLNQTLTFAKGHAEFKHTIFPEHEQEFLRLVKEGQNPEALYIGCSDSRIVPDLILKTVPGQLFVIRTAGNFVPPFSTNAWDGVSATIQYAVEVLKIKHVIVCGHSHCGAIDGLYRDWKPDELPIVQNWLKFGAEAKKLAIAATSPDISKEELNTLTGEISVIYQLEHLLTFPFVRNLVEQDKLALHGWYYRQESGVIYYYEPKSYRFFPLEDLLRKDVLGK